MQHPIHTALGLVVAATLGATGLVSAFERQAAAPHSGAIDWAQHSCESAWHPQPGSQDYWRWEAYHNLDCAIALIDQRMQVGSEGSETAATVTMSRQDLEKLRALIRDGKDGAMRAAAERD
jgi:hypothetical protein